MQGVCTQKHFPAVAQPFRVLWAPWSLAALGMVSAIVISGFSMALFGATVGGLLLALLFPLFHLLAIIFGLKLRYLSTMVTSLENRKSGVNNLSNEQGGFEYANI